MELEIEAAGEAAVFEEALAALRELLGGEAAEIEEVRHELELAAADRAVLLADWIAELAYLAETEGFVPDRVEQLEFDRDGLRALVVGRRGEPPHLVKAVTYHRLALERREDRWHGRVVLDV